MGLLSFLRRLLFGEPIEDHHAAAPASAAEPDTTGTAGGMASPAVDDSPQGAVAPVDRCSQERQRTARRRVRLTPRQWSPDPDRWTPAIEVSGSKPPYRFAHLGIEPDSYFDLSGDGDVARLSRWGLPVLRVPQDIADFLDVPLGRLAWLIHRFDAEGRPESVGASHYHYRWVHKRSGGLRLIEAPKPTLKRVQRRILAEILQRVPAHPAAHGFVRGRSARSNAACHAGARLVLRFDLSDFYGSIGFNRVVAVFRGLGYSREAALWLARLTTSILPLNVNPPVPGSAVSMLRYQRRHLPQGAPTSPALANLAAFPLDLRLDGLARCFSARYTRYADDLTISGGAHLDRGLRVLLPLVRQIVKQERFRLNDGKFRILRSHQRQLVTGAVVNTHPNVPRSLFDELKAVLTNCIRHGPQSQNRQGCADFAAHLRGRIAYVQQLNPARGAKLLRLYRQIDWSAVAASDGPQGESKS